MWLGHEKEHGTEIRRSNMEEAWTYSETFKTLTELNEQCLELLTEQAQAETVSAPMLRELRDLWGNLDAASRQRAGACPYLLIDAGFTDVDRWRWAGGHRLGVCEPATATSFFTVPQVSRIATQIFHGAWYVARTQPLGAPLFLGMPHHCASVLRACSMRQVTDLAEQHAGWLRPRWLGRPKLWRGLLSAAITNDGHALERARLQGVQMLAAELRTLERAQLAQSR